VELKSTGRLWALQGKCSGKHFASNSRPVVEVNSLTMLIRRNRVLASSFTDGKFADEKTLIGKGRNKERIIRI